MRSKDGREMLIACRRIVTFGNSQKYFCELACNRLNSSRRNGRACASVWFYCARRARSRRTYVANQTIICWRSSECAGTRYRSTHIGWAQWQRLGLEHPTHRRGQSVCKSHRREDLELICRRGSLRSTPTFETHGLRTIPGVNATLLTGYPYNEFYDWDLVL